MELNSIIFPSPSPGYTPFSLPGLIWIPRSRFFSLKSIIKGLEKSAFTDAHLRTRSYTKGENISPKKQVYIPCSYYTYPEGSQYILIYFHGNAEDLGYASEFSRKLSIGLKVNVLSVEYPGYGAYNGYPCAKTILEDAEIIYDYLTTELKIPHENIILFGRSIGSGPATYLASNRNPGLLILMSPYTSIKEVVKDIIGRWATIFIAERFRNIDEISNVKCPCFFIHGAKDRLISSSHSKELFSKCKSYVEMNISPNMTHNDYSLVSDVIKPLKKFFKKVNMDRIDYNASISFPDYVKKVPLKKYRKSTSASVKIAEWFYNDIEKVRDAQRSFTIN